MLTSEAPGEGDYNPADYVAIYDVNFYKTNNPDIVAALGDDDVVLLRHFIDYGMRRADKVVQPLMYGAISNIIGSSCSVWY